MINKVEKYLIRLAVICLLMVVVSQGLMTSDPIRFYMSWSERMEGQSLPTPVNAPRPESSSSAIDKVSSPDALITISHGSDAALTDVKILVNGKARYAFSRQQIKMRLKAGDTLEIDARSCNAPVDFTVAATSGNLAFPAKGQVFTANQSMVMIGKIIVK